MRIPKLQNRTALSGFNQTTARQKVELATASAQFQLVSEALLLQPQREKPEWQRMDAYYLIRLQNLGDYVIGKAHSRTSLLAVSCVDGALNVMERRGLADPVTEARQLIKLYAPENLASPEESESAVMTTYAMTDMLDQQRSADLPSVAAAGYYAFRFVLRGAHFTNNE